ncbi:hypothetical protein J2S71_000407 [Olsenella profusa DSM 13989]|nr:hypothetical protein [Olsenella profusa DSM 13989]
MSLAAPAVFGSGRAVCTSPFRTGDIVAESRAYVKARHPHTWKALWQLLTVRRRVTGRLPLPLPPLATADELRRWSAEARGLRGLTPAWHESRRIMNGSASPMETRVMRRGRSRRRRRLTDALDDPTSRWARGSVLSALVDRPVGRGGSKTRVGLRLPHVCPVGKSHAQSNAHVQKGVPAFRPGHPATRRGSRG